MSPNNHSSPHSSLLILHNSSSTFHLLHFSSPAPQNTSLSSGSLSMQVQVTLLDSPRPCCPGPRFVRVIRVAPYTQVQVSEAKLGRELLPKLLCMRRSPGFRPTCCHQTSGHRSSYYHPHYFYHPLSPATRHNCQTGASTKKLACSSQATVDADKNVQALTE